MQNKKGDRHNDVAGSGQKRNQALKMAEVCEPVSVGVRWATNEQKEMKEMEPRTWIARKLRRTQLDVFKSLPRRT